MAFSRHLSAVMRVTARRLTMWKSDACATPAQVLPVERCLTFVVHILVLGCVGCVLGS